MCWASTGSSCPRSSPASEVWRWTDRFGTGAAWTALSTPAPALQDAVCTFDCVIDQVSDVGTHSVLFCRVLAIGDIKPTRNLLYHERQYKVCPAAQQSATP